MERLSYWSGLFTLPLPVAVSMVFSDLVAWLRRWWIG